MKFLIYTLIILFCSFNLFANEPEKPMREEVRTAMKNNLTEIKACYDKLLKTDSGASGKIVLDIEVNDEGKVVSSKVNPGKSRWMTNDGKGKEGLSLAKMEACLGLKIKNIALPAAKKGMKEYITYPFVFGSR